MIQSLLAFPLSAAGRSGSTRPVRRCLAGGAQAGNRVQALASVVHGAGGLELAFGLRQQAGREGWAHLQVSTP